ncbi:unnamed protein product [Boreogadus saida]
MDSECSLPGQLASVERSTVFLQQEHVSLLQGLHLEVLALQKRCTELACELSMKSPGKNQIELQEEVELLEARCRAAEVGVAEKQCTLGDLRQEVGLKGAVVGALRANLKEKERHFLEELKRRSHRSTMLNTELQKQTEAAAYLSFQLHAARQKLHHQRMQVHGQRQQSLARGQGAHSGGGGFGGHSRPSSPQCPTLVCATSPVVKPKRRSVARPFPGQVRLERARECVPREMITGPAEPTAMPDPALFLHPLRHRVRPRRSPAQRPGRAEVEEGGGEGLVEPHDEELRMSASLAPPAAQAKAEQQLM